MWNLTTGFILTESGKFHQHVSWYMNQSHLPWLSSSSLFWSYNIILIWLYPHALKFVVWLQCKSSWSTRQWYLIWFQHIDTCCDHPSSIWALWWHWFIYNPVQWKTVSYESRFTVFLPDILSNPSWWELLYTKISKCGNIEYIRQVRKFIDPAR